MVLLSLRPEENDKMRLIEAFCEMRPQKTHDFCMVVLFTSYTNFFKCDKVWIQGLNSF